ncbi:hypothetical protein Mcup_1117 [Metallosphaera cuprina Ar-4]|uniref:Uncharacterized protein n=1 Tax=Metallosphaera cuprina (strain Ar-4) TaxID=1006006 RepID=F4G324_METCR|nr:hypothetical protein Mcup_1117 [Metallosphaera cuprina Ar-4]
MELKVVEMGYDTTWYHNFVESFMELKVGKLVYITFNEIDE